MPTPRAQFEAHIETPDADVTVCELRKNLTELKLETLEQVQGVDEEGLRVVMPGLYEQIVVTQVQLAAHVGFGVCLALTAHDELTHGASLSRFTREVRDQMTEMGVALKKRHASRLGHMVAEVEAQRLALRHSHEFASWLAFRRDDARYPPKERLDRLKAFKVDERLLQSRGVLIDLLGLSLTVALEGGDRFLLGNRWRLSVTPAHDVERYVWPLLSYHGAAAVQVEHKRWEYDALVEEGVPPMRLEQARAEIADLFKVQLAEALNNLPQSALAGGF